MHDTGVTSGFPAKRHLKHPSVSPDGGGKVYIYRKRPQSMIRRRLYESLALESDQLTGTTAPSTRADAGTVLECG